MAKTRLDSSTIILTSTSTNVDAMNETTTPGPHSANNNNRHPPHNLGYKPLSSTSSCPANQSVLNDVTRQADVIELSQHLTKRMADIHHAIIQCMSITLSKLKRSNAACRTIISSLRVSV
jgi:hypothetical protein